jgi:transposase
MWVPPEDVDPVLIHAPTRKQSAFFGAVCPDDGRMQTLMAERFNSDTFQCFLEVLLRRRRKGRKMVVILDNARWHHARALRPWLEDRRHILRLDYLPPYSPELNPIERVWKLTRLLCTHNQYFGTLCELVEVVQNQFIQWMNPNLQLRRLCAII